MNGRDWKSRNGGNLVRGFESLPLRQELSLRAELHQRWVSNVETGKRNPSYASLRRLAAGLELSASELLARAEQLEATESMVVNTGT